MPELLNFRKLNDPGVAAGEEARIINIPTLPYRYTNPDEYRFPWNSEEIPYRWPAHVTRGG